MNEKNNANISKPVRDPRHRKFRLLSTSLTVIVIVGIILLNVIVSTLADRYPFTIDMSSDKVFTLSEESKNIAASMEKDVQVVIFADVQSYFIDIAEQLYAYYYTSYGEEVNLSNELERLSREIETSLAQLQTHSGNKLTYSFIIPDQEPEKYAEYSKYNLGDNNVLFISGERYRKTELSTMCDLSSIYSVTSKVEQVLISNIFALQGDNDRIIQVLTGHEEDAYTLSGLQRLYELNGYLFEELLITGSADFNNNSDTLLIPAPAKDYSAQEIQRIRTWLKNDNKRNRNLMVFINPTADCPNLYEMLKTDFQIEVTDQLIYESDPNRYHHDGEKYNFGIVSADVPSNDYTKNSSGDLAVVMPRVRRLICNLPESSEGIAQLGIPLTTHPDTAWVSRMGSDGDKVTLDADAYPLTSSVVYEYESFDDNTQQSATTLVTVCGSAEMAYDLYVRNTTLKNEDLLLDIVHAVTGYETNLSISTKVIAKDVTTFTPGTQMVLGIWVFTVGLPVIILVVSLIVFLRRRSL